MVIEQTLRRKYKSVAKMSYHEALSDHQQRNVSSAPKEVFNHQLLEPLGSGAFGLTTLLPSRLFNSFFSVGEVWKAKDPKNQICALKRTTIPEGITGEDTT